MRAAALLHDIPVIIDELQSKGAPGGQASKRQIVEDLLYSLSLGHERGALNSDRSMMRAGSWRSLTIATGEIPIVGESTQQGAANRTLELNAEPFADVRQAQAMHHLVAREHGTAGRAFVEALRRNGQELYAQQFAQMRDAVGSIAYGHPQADNIALLAFADALAEFYVFSPGSDWQGCLDGALTMAVWALGNATGSEGGDTDLKAIQFVAEWLVGNRIHFDDYCENDRLERWGAIEDKTCATGYLWYVFSSVLDRALAGANYDRAKTLRRMEEEGCSSATPATATPSKSGSATRDASTASASTTKRWRRSWSGPPRAPARPSSRLKAASHAETGLETAIPAGEDEGSRLPSQRLYGNEGKVGVARGRARAHGRAGLSRRGA